MCNLKLHEYSYRMFKNYLSDCISDVLLLCSDHHKYDLIKYDPLCNTSRKQQPAIKRIVVLSFSLPLSSFQEYACSLVQPCPFPLNTEVNPYQPY